MDLPTISTRHLNLNDKRRHCLARIAEAMNCPVEVLFDGTNETDAYHGAEELLRLWFAIRNPQQREIILATARAAAKSHGEESP